MSCQGAVHAAATRTASRPSPCSDTAQPPESGQPICKHSPRALPPRGVTVALVTRPYRVDANPSAASETSLDLAWTAVWPTATGLGVPVIAGGRSAGAQVACRTAVRVSRGGDTRAGFGGGAVAFPGRADTLAVKRKRFPLPGGRRELRTVRPAFRQAPAMPADGRADDLVAQGMDRAVRVTWRT